MPRRAGRSSGLGDYLRRRCAERGLSLGRLSLALGRPRSYVPNAAAGRFRPSPDACCQIALVLGDDPLLVLILAGHAGPERGSWLAQVALAAVDVPERRRVRILRAIEREKKQARTG